MSRYLEIAKEVVKEHEKVLLEVSDEDIEKICSAIENANGIQVYGTGRMYCSVKGFVMRLMHMGYDAHEVFTTTCPNIKPGDLLITNCACTAVYGMVMRLAKKAGATVLNITAHPDDEYGKLADFNVKIRGQILPGAPNGEIPSIQPMAALFEQTMFVFCDIIIMLLMERNNITAERMERRRTNLDGYMDLD